MPVRDIRYDVRQLSATSADMLITVELNGDPSAGSPPSTLQVSPPPGVAFAHCSPPGCSSGMAFYLLYSQATVSLNFKAAFFRTYAIAIARFPVRASSFGLTQSDVSAAASIPDINYQGPGPATLLVTYDFPGASSYDWSSLPTNGANNHAAAWEETLTVGDNPGRVAVGINHAAQARDNTKTLFAGTLLGLAGAAILAAIQEALHADTREAGRRRPRSENIQSSYRTAEPS